MIFFRKILVVPLNSPRNTQHGTEPLDLQLQEIARQFFSHWDIQQGVKVILVFDEAHNLLATKFDDMELANDASKKPWSYLSELHRVLRLLKTFSLFSVFMSTTGKIQPSVSTVANIASTRIWLRPILFHPPFCALGFDQLAEIVPIDGTYTLSDVTKIAFLVKLGRPLYDLIF